MWVLLTHLTLILWCLCTSLGPGKLHSHNGSLDCHQSHSTPLGNSHEGQELISPHPNFAPDPAPADHMPVPRVPGIHCDSPTNTPHHSVHGAPVDVTTLEGRWRGGVRCRSEACASGRTAHSGRRGSGQSDTILWLLSPLPRCPHTPHSRYSERIGWC